MNILTHPTTTNRKTKMNINQILATVIKSDPALTGFTPDDLPIAAKARVQNTLVSLERGLSDEDIDALEAWTGGNEIFNSAEFSFGFGECRYYVFEDGSFYFASSGDSEVWAFASDFATDRICNGYDGPLGKADAALLEHLGSFYEEVIEDRGVQK